MYDYDIDLYGWMAHVVAPTDAKAKYAAYKVFRKSELFSELSFRAYIADARISAKVRKIP